MFTLDSVGLGLALTPGTSLPYVFKQINDGNWHYVILTWDRDSGHVDFVRHGETDGYFQGGSLLGGGGGLLSCGHDHLHRRRVCGLCVDFNKEVTHVKDNLAAFPGDVFRWHEVVPHGNTATSRPSSAAISLCPQGQLSPGCDLPRDTQPPTVVSCPGIISVPTVYDKAEVTCGVRLRPISAA